MFHDIKHYRTRRKESKRPPPEGTVPEGFTLFNGLHTQKYYIYNGFAHAPREGEGGRRPIRDPPESSKYYIYSVFGTGRPGSTTFIVFWVTNCAQSATFIVLSAPGDVQSTIFVVYLAPLESKWRKTYYACRTWVPKVTSSSRFLIPATFKARCL